MYTLKATYSLRPETVENLEALSAKWRVSKSETLRRVIARVAQEEGATAKVLSPLEALDLLQKTSRLDPAAAADFNKEVRDERRASNRG